MQIANINIIIVFRYGKNKVYPLVYMVAAIESGSIVNDAIYGKEEKNML